MNWLRVRFRFRIMDGCWMLDVGCWMHEVEVEVEVEMHLFERPLLQMAEVINYCTE